MADPMILNVMVFTGVMTAMIITGRLLFTVVNAHVARKGPASANVSALEDRLTRIEQIVEATALEIERIGEGQRFTTKVLTERAAVPAALAPPNPRNPIT